MRLPRSLARSALVATALVATSALGCSRSASPENDGGALAVPSASPPLPLEHGVESRAVPDAALAAALPAPKAYKRVLHAGDSMVGGGLARALRPKVEAEGAKYYRDVWESGSLRAFSRSDRIPKLMKEW